MCEAKPARGAEVTVWCNHPDCEAELVVPVPAGTRDVVAFELAGRAGAAAGWQVDTTRHDAESVDYCPDHHVVEVPGA